MDLNRRTLVQVPFSVKLAGWNMFHLKTCDWCSSWRWIDLSCTHGTVGIILSILTKICLHVCTSNITSDIWRKIYGGLLLFVIGCPNKNKTVLLISTHWGLVMPYGTWNLVNLGWHNCCVLDGIKPLPQPILTSHQLSIRNNFNQIIDIFMYENIGGNHVCKMVAILFRPQFVTTLGSEQNGCMAISI